MQGGSPFGIVGSVGRSSDVSHGWGILNALISIGVAGQASIDKVAGPVGEALIATAMASSSLCLHALLQLSSAQQRSSKSGSAAFASDLQTYLSPTRSRAEGDVLTPAKDSLNVDKRPLCRADEAELNTRSTRRALDVMLVL